MTIADLRTLLTTLIEIDVVPPDTPVFGDFGPLTDVQVLDGTVELLSLCEAFDPEVTPTDPGRD
jgi:hypothetical protein